MLDAGCWMLALATSCWLLAAGFWSLASGIWQLVARSG